MNGKNFSAIYISLVLNAVILIITGLFIGRIFAYFSVNISNLAVNIFKAIFILSGLANIWLIFYTKKKLS